MAAEKFSLLIDSQTTGTAEIEKLSAALNKVVDSASKANKTTEESARRTTSTVSGLQQQLQSFRNVLTNPLEAAGEAAEGFALSFGKIGLVAAGATAAVGAVGGLSLKLVSSMGDAAERMGNFADRTGLTVAQVDRLQAMSRIAGVNIEGLEGQARILADTLSDAGGAGAKAQKALDQLGVSARDDAGRMREMGPVLLEVLQSLSRVEKQADRVTLANQLLGRGSAELQPLIKNFRDLEREAEKLGFGIETGVIDELAKAGDEVDKLSLKWEQLKRELAVPAIGVVSIITKVVAAFEGATQFAAGAATGSAGRFAGPPGAPLPIGRPGAPSGPETLLPGLNAQIIEKQARDAAMEAYRKSRVATEVAQKERLAEIEKEIIAKDSALMTSVSVEARKALNRQIADLRAEKATIEAAQKATQERNAQLKQLADLKRPLTELEKAIQEAQKEKALREKLAEFQAAETRELAPAFRRAPSLLTGRERILRGEALGGALAVDTTAIATANAANQAAQAEARLAGIAQRQRQEQELSLRTLEQTVELESRRLELIAGPGGELEASRQVMELRLSSLEKQVELGRDLRDAELEALRIRKEFELEILSLRKQQREEGRRAAESLFDAAIAGGQGIRSFLTSTALQIPRTIAGNIGAELGGLTGRFSLGLGGLPGRLVAGTPFGADPLKAAGDIQMNAAQIQLQAAALQIGAARGTVAAVAGGGAPGSIFGGATGPGGTIFNLAGGGSLPSFGASQGARNLDLLSTIYGVPLRTRPGFGLQQGVGAAAALAGGVFGAYSGYSAGGLQGALTGTSSLAGTAAALLPLIGVSGPAAPIIGGVALAMGLAAALMGDPKKRRAEQIESTLRGRQYAEPGAVSISEDMYARSLYEDYRGGIRPSPRTVVIQNNYDVSTIDAQGVQQFFIDHHEELGKGMYKAIVSGTEAVPAMARELGLA